VSEWQELNFCDLLIEPVRNGIYKEKSFHGRGTKIVNMGELFSYPRLRNVPMKRLELNDNERRKCLLNKGDLIFARRSLTAEGAGKCSIIKEIDEDTTFESSIIRARPNPEITDSDFLYYLFNAPYGKYQLGTILRQVAVAGITGSDLMQLVLKVPCLDEQKAIASVLSSLDDKIELFHRQNTTLERMAETLFRQWFVEEVQEDWEVKTLKDEFDFTMGQSPAGSSFNENGVGIPMFQGNADFGFRFPTERVYTTEPARFAELMDTLISVRAPVGAQNMAKVKCCIGRGLAAFRYKSNPNFYTYTYFKLRSLMEEIKQFNDEGTVFGSISKTDFENLVTSIPSDKDVLRFENEAKPINDKIINNCEQIQTLEKLRDNLLPKLMSGDIRVKTN